MNAASCSTWMRTGPCVRSFTLPGCYQERRRWAPREGRRRRRESAPGRTAKWRTAGTPWEPRRSGPVQQHAPAVAGGHDREAPLEVGVGEAVGDHGLDVEAALQ